MRIVDKSGVWVINTGDFRLPIYDRVGEPRFLEPSEPTKIEMTPFLKAQTQVTEIEDPTAETPKVKVSK